MKYVLSILGISIISYIAYASLTEADQSLLDKTIEFNNQVYTDCFENGWRIQDSSNSSGQAVSTYSNGSGGVASWSVPRTDTQRYRTSTDCWKAQRKLTPDDLFLTVPKYLVDEGRCSISQSEDSHVEAKNGGMYATDLACNFEAQGVYAPDYLDQMIEYKIESVWYDNLLGNFVILSFQNDTMSTSEQGTSRWYFWHTLLDPGWKVGQSVTTWVRFAHANISGATTWWHTHIELRRMYDGIWQSVRYVTRGKERRLEEKRLSNMNWLGTMIWSTGSVIYYFTHYDLWSVAQNDAAPCISADWNDSCKVMSHGRNTMALTVDVRKSLGINFWDKVALTGEVGCEGIYTVTDELACRFRGEYAWANGPCTYSDGETFTPKISNVFRPGTPYYIKGDLPGRPGGACSIRKL